MNIEYYSVLRSIKLYYCVLATSSNALIPKSVQSNGVNLLYFNILNSFQIQKYFINHISVQPELKTLE